MDRINARIAAEIGAQVSQVESAVQLLDEGATVPFIARYRKEKTGGLELFSAMLAAVATPSTMTGVVAFVTGVISVFSSTSGVVLPAFLPTIPSVIARLGGGDPFALAASMNIGSHLVDMSPLSTTGAVCLAGVHDPKDFKATYNKLLAWGASMTIVGAIGCYLFF